MLNPSDYIALTGIIFSLLYAAFNYDLDKKDEKELETKNNNQISKSTAGFVFAILIAALAIIGWAFNKVAAEKKEEKENSHYNEVTEIKKITDTISIGIDTLGFYFVSLDTSVQKRFNGLIEQLNKLENGIKSSVIQGGKYLEEQRKFVSLTEPAIDFIDGSSSWRDVDSTHKALNLIYSNSGGRLALDFKMETHVLYIKDTLLNRLDSISLDEKVLYDYHLTSKIDRIPPFSMRPLNRFVTMSNITNEEFETIDKAIIHFRYTFKDKYNNETITKSDFMAYSKSFNAYKFAECTDTGKELFYLYKNTRI